MADDCVFCKIAAKEIPAALVYEDDQVVAFNDLEPQAPVHVLIIPQKHIANVLGLKAEKELAGHILGEVVPVLTEKLGLKDGFRLVANTGAQGGQTVMHLHFHLLGGRDMAWPPG